MTLFRLCSGQNGGSSLRSISETTRHCYAFFVPTLSFVNKRCSLDPKSPWQQPMDRLTIHRSGTTGTRLNSISHSSVHSYQILSDPKNYNGEGSEICKFRPNKTLPHKDDDNIYQKLDQWIRNSIPEIVNNIEQAPFLVYIYSDDGNEGSSSTTSIRLEREKANAENWSLIRGRWAMGIAASPNGIILVEELHGKKLDTSSDAESCNNTGADSKLEDSTRLWGVLIQVKGEHRTACYILKTCTIQTMSGFCTHFCLAKIKCFDESAETQLRKLWLQML